jgi:polyisoprenoid-binding protein YceI
MTIKEETMRTLAFALFALLTFDVHTTTRPTDTHAATRPHARASVGGVAAAPAAPAARFRVDPARSDFMVRAFASGALFFKGHDHFVRPSEFSGDVELTPGAINPASLTMRVSAASLAETRDVFTPQQKGIINKELREIVIEPDKYPEITFKSTNVTVETPAGGEFRARIAGDLTLHGVTRRVEIPVRVTLAGNDLRARGEFGISRKDFNVKATSAFHGTVRVRDELRVIFNIVARHE